MKINWILSYLILAKRILYGSWKIFPEGVLRTINNIILIFNFQFSLFNIFLAALLFQIISVGCYAQEPFKLTSPGDLITGGLVIPLNIGGSYLYRHKPPLTEERIRLLDVNSINKFDRSATKNYSIKSAEISEGVLITCLLAPSLMLLDDDIRKDGGTEAVIYFETIGITAAEISLVKRLVNRVRPFVYNADVSMNEKLKPDANCSFFSGHTAMASAACFFAAGIYTGYKPDNEWIWVAAAVPALATGLFRYTAGKHFFTDILAGFLAGSLNGYIVTRLHRD